MVNKVQYMLSLPPFSNLLFTSQKLVTTPELCPWTLSLEWENGTEGKFFLLEVHRWTRANAQKKTKEEAFGKDGTEKGMMVIDVNW